MASAVKVGVSYVLGRCVPSVKQNAAKIRVTQLVFDERVKMHFEEQTHVFAHDPEKRVKTGDIVLVRQLPKKVTTLITHSVEEIVYRLGDIIDPITGKPVVVERYRDDIEETNRMYGKVKGAFDYSKAPPRGRLEGTKDLSDKPTYTKYHEDGSTDPYAW